MKIKKEKKPHRKKEIYCRTCGAIVTGDRCKKCGTPIDYIKLRGIK